MCFDSSIPCVLWAWGVRFSKVGESLGNLGPDPKLF